MSQLDLLDLFQTPASRPTSDDSGVRGPCGSAVFSPDGAYRFDLRRWWGDGKLIRDHRPVVMIGCNPSTAGADFTDNDPTTRKGIGFATRWGYDGLIMVNPHAFIATKPKAMEQAAKSGVDVVGRSTDDALDNDGYLRRAIGWALLNNGMLVLACGNDVTTERMLEVERIVRFSGVTPMCLGRNGKDQRGNPKHILYLSYATPLVPYELGVLAA